MGVRKFKEGLRAPPKGVPTTLERKRVGRPNMLGG